MIRLACNREDREAVSMKLTLKNILVVNILLVTFTACQFKLKVSAELLVMTGILHALYKDKQVRICMHSILLARSLHSV
jgi:hypothetical protein